MVEVSAVGGPVGMTIVVGELETVIEGEKIVVAGLEPCGMVKEGMTALIRLVNLIALRTAEHSGLELNSIELEYRVSLIENTFYARYTYWFNLTEGQYSQLVGHGCLVQRSLGKHICGLALRERVFGQLVGNFCRIVRPDSPSPEYGADDGGDDLKNDEGYFIHCEYPYPCLT